MAFVDFLCQADHYTHDELQQGGETNENMYERFGMGTAAMGVDYAATEWGKCDAMKWFMVKVILYRKYMRYLED